MASPPVMQRLRDMEWDPTLWMRQGLKVMGRALTRLWGRDVMLYTGGVSFFIMLAIFPMLAILIGAYSLLSDPTQATPIADAFAALIPAEARGLFRNQLAGLARAPSQAVSAQSGLALIIGGYAAHRGFKALLAGLSFVHDEDEPRGFLGFNLLALMVLMAAFAMVAVVSTLFFGIRLISATFSLRPLAGVSWLYNEWTWTSIGLTLALTLIYRFAMSRRPVAWRASVAGGVMAALLCLGASWGCAIYVEQIVHLGVTYGSVTTVVVFLIYLSWNVNVVFFGGALATEIEIAIDEQAQQILEAGAPRLLDAPRPD